MKTTTLKTRVTVAPYYDTTATMKINKTMKNTKKFNLLVIVGITVARQLAKTLIVIVTMKTLTVTPFPI